MKKAMLFTIALTLVSAHAAAEEFSYNPPGQLVSGSGTGRADNNVYVQNMRFPIEAAPAYPNSQVWGVGGSQGPSGGQCDERNYSYPWWDNFCESRRWDMPLCPSGNGHQGQDMRPSTCQDKTHFVVAAEAGTITSIGSYSVYLVTDNGTTHRYLHMDPGTLRVSQGQQVAKGDRLGLVSNAFNGTPTTIHLHYDIKQYVASVGQTIFVPSYMSLVRSYETLIGEPAQPCAVLPEAGGTIDDYGECFTAFGNPTYWREENGGVDGKFHWTNAWTNDTPGNWARWSIHVAKTSEYKVEFNVVSSRARSKQVRYAIKHAGGEESVIVDQSAVNEWGELGTFTFEKDKAHAVEVFDNTGESASDLHITADSIRLTPVGATDPDPEPEPDPDTDPDPPPTDPTDPGPDSDPSVNDDPSGPNPQGHRDTPESYVPGQGGAVSTSNGCSAAGGFASWWLVFLMMSGMLGRRKLLRR